MTFHESLRVLVIEDNPADLRLLQEALKGMRRPAIKLVCTDRLAAGLHCLTAGDIDLVLLDLSLPDSFGWDTFHTVYEHVPHLPVVILTGLEDEGIALRAVREGAQDYLPKGELTESLLGRTIRYAVERHHLMTRIKEQAQKLERDRVRARFLQMAAHDLRDPMAVAKGTLTIMRLGIGRGRPLDDMARRLQLVEREIDRVSTRLNEVLEAFLLGEERLPLKCERIDLAKVIHTAIEPYQALEDGNRFLLEGMNRDTARVFGDFNRLVDVFRNLLANASKYSPASSEIRLTLEVTGGFATISVRDQGIGIPPDQLSKIFEGFFRADNARNQALEGLGLGLYICSGIIHQHGGRIWAESELGSGACFFVNLPLLTAACEGTDQQLDAAAAASNHPAITSDV